MNLLYFLVALGFVLSFYILPILGNFEDPRPFIKTLSVITFALGSWTIYGIKKKKYDNVAHEDKLLYTPVKEIYFTICLLLSFSVNYLFTLFQHLNSFFLVDYDFLAIAEILNNSLSGNFFITHHYGTEVTGNYLSHHFSPSIIILSPFQLLSNTRMGYAYGLLLFIVLSFVLLAILLLKKNIRGNTFYFSMLLFASNIYLHRVFYSYHFELLTIFFFLLFFVGKEFNRIYISIPSIILLLLLKEDMAIYISCLGLYFLLQRDWKYALALITISVLYFFFIPKFFQSYLDNSASVNWLKDWSYWGDSYAEITLNILSSPIQILKIFLLKWKVLKDFILSFSPIILLTPSLIIVSLPIFLLHFISDRIWYNSLYNYYAYSVIPFFILSLLFSLQKIKFSKYDKYSLSIVIFSISISLYSSSGDKLFPYKKMETDMERVECVNEAVSQISEKKTVATQFDLGGFIPRTNPLYPLHEKNLDKDYLLIDTKKGITPYVDRIRIERMIQSVRLNHIHSLLYEKNGIQLYKKN